MSRCENDEQAMNLARHIATMIGDLDVNQDLTDVQLEAIARRAERIARWARGEVKRRKEKA